MNEGTYSGQQRDFQQTENLKFHQISTTASTIRSEDSNLKNRLKKISCLLLKKYIYIFKFLSQQKCDLSERYLGNNERKVWSFNLTTLIK